MYELARVRLFSVGPAGARYQDVTLDLRGVGPAVAVSQQEDLFAPDAVDTTPRRPSPASVLFLENGGGKSVLLKLVFSVLLPGRRQVVGTTSTTVLEKFVLAEDVAHVACEWMHTATGRLLVTGKVSEWRGHVASSDPEKLADAWYSFRPVPGFGLDDLPFTLERRRVTSSAFRDRLHEADRDLPDCELTWETGQRDWTRHLVDTGLDPELFRYQRAMNAGEGEAAEAFSFPNDEAFVDFLLRAVLDPEEPQTLADLVAGYASKLAQRAELETEREFVNGTLERLAPLGDAEEAAAVAREREAAARDAAAALAGAIVARRAAEREQVSAAAEQLVDAEEEAARAARDEEGLAATVAELRRLTAALEVVDAERAEADAVAAQREAAAVVEAWSTVEPLRQHRLAAAEAARLRTRVDSEQEKARPALVARRDAALALAAALRATAGAADAAAEAADTERAASVQRAEGAHKIQLERVSEAAGADGTARQAAEALTVVDGRVSAAVEAGHLVSVETDVDGAALRAREDADAAARSLTDLHAELDALRRNRRGAEQRRAGAQGEAASARAAAVTARTALDDALTVRAALADSDRAAELLGVDTVRPDSDAELVATRLRAAIGAGELERTELIGDQARDQRALRALGEGGLLPDPPEIESVLGVLEAAGITAWSGRRYLAMLPATDRESTVERIPHLAGGVLLNRVEDAPRAREELAAARLLPSYVVAVGSTAAMDPGDGEGAPGVELVVPPNPAMYDETAAEALREQLTTETGARGERLDALAERLESDRRLRARFDDWAARRPTVDELTEADERADGACHAAESELATTAAEVEALDEQTDRLAADRSRREEAAATARTRADALESLRVEVARRPELRERQRDAEETAARARAAAETAATEAEDAQRAAGVAQQARDRQTTTAARAREELGDLPVGEDDTLPDPDADTPLDVLRDGYRRAAEEYRSAEVDTDLRAALDVAEERERTARRPLDGVGAAALEAADALLRSPDGADAASRRAAAGWARAALEEADSRKQQAGTALALARKELKGLPAGGGDPADLEAYGTPTDVAHGRDLTERASADRRAAEETSAAAHRTARSARDAHRVASASAEGFTNLVDGMDDPPDAVGAALVPPFDGDVAAAVAASKSRQAAVRNAAGERAGAERQVRDAVDAVALFAQDARFATLTSPVHRHIAGVARAEMPGLAPEWVRALRPRLRSLDDDLANIERHRSGIVVRLAGMVGEALRTLALAQRLSELPEGLGDWSGQQFLRIRFDRLDDAVLHHELGDVVDRTATAAAGTGKTRELRDGMSLLLRGVRAAMPKGVRVEMLKPDAVLRTERLRVSEIRDVFSGGQQLTAAIVLYCTMAALRAHQRGQGRRPHAGVLFLDNPIGRASAGYLLELQFGVARALGVQLVYTTGLFDAGALSAFPLIIRLRNDADLRAGRKYLSVDDRVATALGDLPESDGTGGVTASRLYRRPSPDEA